MITLESAWFLFRGGGGPIVRERAGASAARNEKWAAIDDRTSVWFFVFRFPGRGAAFLWATIFLRSVSGYGCVCVCVCLRARWCFW